MFVAVMHLFAYAVVGRLAGIGPHADRTTLIVITGSLLLSWSLMVSQAMESMTRVFYACAKFEAVLGVIAFVFTPFIAAVAVISATHALLVAVGIAAASAAAIQIQLWFRSQARRGDFRRRQISSRTATFAEAFSSIAWATAAALAATSAWLSLIVAAIAAVILQGAWLISPARLHARRPAHATRS